MRSGDGKRWMRCTIRPEPFGAYAILSDSRLCGRTRKPLPRRYGYRASLPIPPPDDAERGCNSRRGSG